VPELVQEIHSPRLRTAATARQQTLELFRT
jgi:hypothetical protein